MALNAENHDYAGAGMGTGPLAWHRLQKSTNKLGILAKPNQTEIFTDQ